MATLSADTRRRALDRLTSGDPLDLLVIGGGVTGAGVALDAATGVAAPPPPPKR